MSYETAVASMFALGHELAQTPLQKFAALKSCRQFLANRLFNYPRPRKPYQRAGFGNIQITQHGKRCRHSARGRVG